MFLLLFVLRTFWSGWGRHSRVTGDSEVKAAVVGLLKVLHLPFAPSMRNKGAIE